MKHAFVRCAHFVVIGLFGSLLSAQSLAAITGNVFRDYNASGTKSTSGTASATATDTGVGAVTVTAYGSGNAVCGTTSTLTTPTASIGNYSLAINTATAGCAGPTYRIEFTDLPTDTQPSAKAIDSVGSGVANSAGSSTQFVTDGATNVNFALNEPCEYCQNNPKLVTAQMFAGNHTNAASNANVGSLVSIDYTAGATPTPTSLATLGQTSAIWGIAYDRTRKVVYSSTFLKRQVALYESPVGTPRLGTVFRTTSPASATPSTTPFLDLEAAPYSIPFGTVPNKVARGIPASAAGATNDETVYGLVAKAGIGDIDVSADGKFLFVMNLFNQTLYRIDLDADGNATTPPAAADVTAYPMTAAAGVAACTNGSWRPFAVGKNKAGEFFVGGVCDASAMGGASSNLEARVYRLDQGSGNFVGALTFPLNYPRGAVYVSTSPVVNCSAAWLPWKDDEARSVNCRNSRYYDPQPILSDIEFDIDGSMILGFSDRYGHQQMAENRRTVGAALVRVYTGGDVLRACASGTSWVLQGGGGCLNTITNAQGPGGGEFYFEGAPIGNHQEPSNGALALLPGSGQMVNTTMDPINEVDQGGFNWYNNTTGVVFKGARIYSSTAAPGSPAQIGSAFKAHGLGDIELLCDEAPIEIGNRVWKDLNGNGIQDPSEPPITGVTVRLYGPDGSGPDGRLGTADDIAGAGGLLGTAVTDAGGEYYFSSGTGTNTANTVYGVSALLPNTVGFKLKIDLAADYTDAAKLQTLSATIPNTEGVLTNNAITDVRDSDAVVPDASAPSNATTNVPTIMFNTTGPGENNHGLDFGFVSPTYSLGNKVWFDTNNNGVIDSGELPIASIKTELLDSTGAKLYRTSAGVLTTTAAGNTAVEATTDAAGYYRFDDLAAGGYQVRVAASNFAPVGGALAGYNSSTGVTGVTSGTGSTNNNDKGVDSATPASTGITSGTVTLGVGSQPSGDVDAGATSAGTNGPSGDALDNLTVDFGFYKLSMGNTVWRDDGTGGGVINNGIKDGSEPGISGVTVELYKGATLVAVTTTDSSGQYMFMQQTTAAGVATGNPLQLGADYQVRIPANQTTLSGLNSSADPTGVATALTADNDDNGQGTSATTGITSSANFSLAAGTNATTGATATNTTATTDQPRVDFGFAPPPTYSLGNKVWFDTNNNGVIDSGELPIASIKTELLDSTGAKLYRTSAGVLTTTAAGNTAVEATTDAAGYYRFDDLAAGGYQVRVAASNFAPVGGALAGYNSSTGVTGVTSGTGSTNNNDKGVDSATPASTGITSGTVTLGVGSQPSGDVDAGATSAGTNGPSGDALDNLTVDFGFYKLSMGNTVWRDDGTGGGVINNGIKDGSEPGISGVTVELYKGATLVAVTTTDSSGQYMFMQQTTAAGVATGNPLQLGADYQVRIPANQTTLSGLNSSADPTGVATALTADNDDNGQGTSATTGITSSANFSLAAGTNATTGATATNTTATTDQPRVDFGFAPPITLSLGNRVWLDANNNGLLDTGETSIANATVYLYADSNNDSVPDGNPVATQATDANGYYLFTALSAGNYIVGVDPSTLPAVAGQAPLKSSTGQNGAVTGLYEGAATPDADTTPTDSDDNGSLATAPNVAGATVPMVLSKSITLVTNTEPTGEADNGPQTDPASDASSNRTVDFGFFRPASLGNFVWLDTNADGVQDAGEAGVPGATVNLYKGGVLIATTTTGANGDYLFDNLVPGADYEVEFVKPPGYTRSPIDAGGDDAKDSDANPTTGRTTPFTLVGGQNNPDIDAGLFFNASLGDRVWYDDNRNGIQDAGEAGVQGVQVTLTTPAGGIVNDINNNPIAPVSTDANGNYNFPNLLPGSYVVTFVPATLPVGYEFTTRGTTGSKDAPDSDPDPLTGKTETITLVSGENDPNWDAGIFKRAIDLVLTKQIAPVSPATGSPWLPGNQVQYTVIVTNNGPDDAQLGWSVSDTLPAALINPAITSVTPAAANCAFSGNALTCNGTQGVRPATAITGINNAALVTQVAITYTAEIAPSASGAITNVAQVTPNATDPAETIPLAATNTNNRGTTTISLAGVASLGNFVWIDGNANGVQDTGEPGVSGVTVTLFDASNNQVATTTTGANGEYQFTGLIPNTAYTVSLNNPANFTAGGVLAEYALTSKDAGGNDALDSDAVLVGNLPTITNATTGAAGSDTPTYDFGFIPLASLGDRVWFDNNRDGIQDTGETGAPNVTVTLYDGGGNPVATTTTNSTGNYAFTGLTPGVPYSVGFSNLPSGYVISPIDQGGNDATDSDADPSTGRTAPVTLSPGENRVTLDAGINQPLVAPASLGDRVWFDANRDGIQDAGEGGVPNVTVTLYDGSGVQIATTTTNSTGNYAFTGLTPGVPYSVGFSNLPSGYVISPQDLGGNDATDSDADTSTGRTATVTLSPGENRVTLDAGINQPLVAPASLGDRVWIDSNGNGAQDTGEPGVTGVTVTLFDSANVQVATTTTNASGNYQFGNLPPNATFTVSLNNPANFATGGALAGYTLTTKDASGNDATDSDSALVGNTPTIINATTGAAGSNTPTYDFGFIPPASLGDRVWFDTNRDGVQDAGETGAPNVTVTLYDGAGTPIATTSTNATGNYVFTGLTPGVPYSVGFSNLPAGYVFSPQDQGASDAVDSDVVPSTGRTAAITLNPGENRVTLDAGINQPVVVGVNVGNFVWRDNNSNGIQDAGEPGVTGVTATITRVDGQPVRDAAGAPVLTTVTTDSNGNYAFNNLAPGQYVVTFSNIPAGLLPTTSTAPGSTTANDSNGLTATSIVLTAGQSDLSLDLGLIAPTGAGSVSGIVFFDSNRGGTRDSGESPVGTGVTVTLINSATGAVIATTVTDALGAYVFNNVPPGNYTVSITPPAGTVATTPITRSVTVSNGATAVAADVGVATAQAIPTLSIWMLLAMFSMTGIAGGIGSRSKRRYA
jgi:SdrD B-like domain